MITPAISRASTFGRWALIGLSVSALACSFAYVGGWFDPLRLGSRQLINTIEASSGVYPGFRRAHAKGLCVSGYFAGNGQASAFSQAALFAPGRVAVTGRLSIPGGNPYAADTSVAVRSMALLLQQDDGQQWRMAMNTPPVLAVATPEGFYAQVQSMRPDPATGKPDPARMQAFFAAHPESSAFRQWAQSVKPSSSFANSRFHSINAFYLVNAAGSRQAVRWAWQPEAPVQALGDTSASNDALQQELLKRLAVGPVRWHLLFSLAEAGDPLTDGTKAWSDSRQQVDAGTLVLEHATSQEQGACRDINFDPLILPAGIEPSADPILHARSAAYAESFKRRTREGAPQPASGVRL
jgi:catalase